MAEADSHRCVAKGVGFGGGGDDQRVVGGATMGDNTDVVVENSENKQVAGSVEFIAAMVSF